MQDNCTTPTKQCSKCKKWFPTTNTYFKKAASQKSGLECRCKKCGSRKADYEFVMPVKEGYKRCNRCKQEKPATPDYFTRWTESADGLRGGCKECFNRKPAKFLASEMIASAGNKICRKCRVELPATLEYFYPCAGHRSDGLDSCCKACDIQTAKAYQSANKEKVDERRKIYRARNIIKLREKAKEKARKNKEKTDKKRKENLDKHRTALVRYRARKVGLPDNFTAAQWQQAINYFGGCCAVCGRVLSGFFHYASADHWIPLTSSECPGTVPSNIVPLCHGLDGCNNSKGSKEPIRWLRERYDKRKATEILNKINKFLIKQKEAS